MSDGTHDHTTDLPEPYDYEDAATRRAMAFRRVAKLPDNLPTIARDFV
jgi:hypothetical protein